MAIGALVGIVLPLLEMKFPKHRNWIPSATGVGLAFVIPCFNSISMFEGAMLGGSIRSGARERRSATSSPSRAASSRARA